LVRRRVWIRKGGKKKTPGIELGRPLRKGLGNFGGWLKEFGQICSRQVWAGLGYFKLI